MFVGGRIVLVPFGLGAASLLATAALGIRKDKPWWRIALCALAILVTGFLVFTAVWVFIDFEAILGEEVLY